MAELVDALGSGPSGGNTVEVRVLFWAPKFPFFRYQYTSCNNLHILIILLYINMLLSVLSRLL